MHLKLINTHVCQFLPSNCVTEIRSTQLVIQMKTYTKRQQVYFMQCWYIVKRKLNILLQVRSNFKICSAKCQKMPKLYTCTPVIYKLKHLQKKRGFPPKIGRKYQPNDASETPLISRNVHSYASIQPHVTHPWQYFGLQREIERVQRFILCSSNSSSTDEIYEALLNDAREIVLRLHLFIAFDMT